MPQADVLAHASAMIGHGGFGTTMGALAAGVPQVVVPIFTSDQLSTAPTSPRSEPASRSRSGPGSVAARVRRGRRLLDEPAYAERARAVAAEFADLPHPVGCRAPAPGSRLVG